MLAPPPAISEGELATPGQRFGASLLDALVLAVPLLVWLFLFLVQLFLSADPGAPFDFPGWYWPVATTVAALYHVVPEALWGQTLGKLVVEIRVCAAVDLGRPGWARALKRWGLVAVPSFIPWVGPLLPTLVVLPILWDSQRQGLHDKFAGTVVLRGGRPV